MRCRPASDGPANGSPAKMRASFRMQSPWQRATAAALATLHAIESQDVLANVAAVGEHLRAALAAIPGVTEVRGEGLLIGFDLDADVAPAVVQAGLDAGFIVNAPGPRTIRLAPDS